MTATAAYSATMPELRGDPASSSLWPNYGGPVHMSPRLGSTMDAGINSTSSASSHSVRPRSEHPNIDHSAYSYRHYGNDDGGESYSGHTSGGLSSQSSYQTSLKRSYSQSEQPPNQEMVQDLRGEDGQRMTVNHSHKLLAFRRSQDKHTITDQHGRLQQLELSAQLHGMFFLSEMPPGGAPPGPTPPTGDGTALQPELTCYRRNLFQISGSLITPRGQMSVIGEGGESVPVTTMEVTISAIESVDGNPVRLIVIPWKTPPPNSPEVQQNPDQEPPALPLIPFQEDGTEAEGEYAIYPIGWRRLQFRIATANNGRRKELQQHFVLHLKVHGTLANNTKVVLTESVTAPIVVRGRSPRNFQARKEIPLLGSSAGSRGQALVETGLGVVAASLNPKQPDPKPPRGTMEMQMPRSTFTFNSPKPPGNPMNPMRSNTYPAWSSPGPGPLSQVPSSSPAPYPTSTMSADPYPKVPMAGGPSYASDHHEIQLPTSLPPSVPMSLLSDDQHSQSSRSQYTYVQSSNPPRQMSVSAPSSGAPTSGVNVPRYMEDSRPPKTSHGTSHHSSGSMTNSETPSEYRYGSYTSVSNGTGDVPTTYGSEAAAIHTGTTRDVYPPAAAWTTTAGETSTTAAYASHDGRPYASPYDHYKGSSSAPQMKVDPGHTSHPDSYSSGSRGSFEAMNNYSWSSS